MRYVAGGNLTHPSSSMTYSSVVSQENLDIALLIEIFKDIEILARDTQSAYQNAKTEKKIYYMTGMNVKM